MALALADGHRRPTGASGHSEPFTASSRPGNRNLSGGSLQVLSFYCGADTSVDIDPTIPARLDGLFPNVTFRTGDSRTILPQVFRELNAAGDEVDFVLVDGDHSREGADLFEILKLSASAPRIILMHDSFNPNVRAGIKSIPWNEYPNVHDVELDLTTGIWFREAHDTATPGQMWGGLACVTLLPSARQAPLLVHEANGPLFQAIAPLSSHAISPIARSFKRIRRRIAHFMGPRII